MMNGKNKAKERVQANFIRFFPFAMLFLVSLSSLASCGDMSRFEHGNTLEGPDTDNDGVRDDIQAYIAELPIRSDMKEKLRKVAKKYREIMLLDLSNETKLVEISRGSRNAVGCVVVSASSEESMQYSEYLDILQDASVNTLKRKRKYRAFNVALSGHLIETNGDPCAEI